MIGYKRAHAILFKAIAMAMVCLFFISDLALGIDLKDPAATSTLAPTSIFGPIVALKWDTATGRYLITEDEGEKAFIIKCGQEDNAFIYLNLLIGQFLHGLSNLSKLGVSNHGLQINLSDEVKKGRLSEFIKSIKQYLPHIDFNRFMFKEMEWEGNTICLPYVRKDSPEDKPIIQILRYYLPDSKGAQFPDRIDIPIGAAGLKVMLEDPLKDCEAFEQALEDFKNGNIHWRRISIDIQREFVNLLANSIGKDPGCLNTSDFQRTIPEFDGRRLVGLLIYYKGVDDNYITAVRNLKRALGIKDLIKAHYINFEEALEVFKSGKIRWSITTPKMRLKFVELLAKSLGKEPGALLTSDFGKHITEFNGKCLAGLFLYYLALGGHRRTYSETLQYLKKELGIKDTSSQAYKYKDFEEAFSVFKKGKIRWSKTTPEMQRKFVDMAAEELGKEAGMLLCEDFNKKIGILNNRSLGGLLGYYYISGRSLSDLKQALGIKDLTDKPTWQEKYSNWDKVFDIIKHCMGKDVNYANINAYLKRAKPNKETDRALGREVQSGNSAAREAMIRAYTKVAEYHAHRLHNNNKDIPEDDLKQEGETALIRLVERYDPENSGDCSFYTYCQQRVSGSMLDYIIAKRGTRRKTGYKEAEYHASANAEEESGYLGEITIHDIPNGSSRHKESIPEKVIDEVRSKLKGKASSRDIDILTARLRGKSFSDIASNANISVSSISFIVAKLRRILSDSTVTNPPKGTPAALLRQMHKQGVFSINPKPLSSFVGTRGYDPDSHSTIYREKRLLEKAQLLERCKKGYYLPDWLKCVDIEEFIKSCPELNEPSPSDKDIRQIILNVLICNPVFNTLYSQNENPDPNIGPLMRETLRKVFKSNIPYMDSIFDEINSLDDERLFAMAEEAINRDVATGKSRSADKRLTLRDMVNAKTYGHSDEVCPADLPQYFISAGAVAGMLSATGKGSSIWEISKLYFRDAYIILRALYVMTKRVEAPNKIQTVDIGRERIIARDLCDAVIMQAVAAKDRGETIVLGLDTSWIPNMNAAQGIIAGFEKRLLRRLADNGYDNVVFERGKGSEVADKVLKAKEMGSVKLSNIIIIGGQDILNPDESNVFNKLRGQSPDDNALMVGINTENLNIATGIRLLEIFLLAFKLNSGNNLLDADTEFVKVSPQDGRPRAFIFTPVKPYDIGESGRIIKLQIEEFGKAA